MCQVDRLTAISSYLYLAQDKREKNSWIFWPNGRHTAPSLDAKRQFPFLAASADLIFDIFDIADLIPLIRLATTHYWAYKSRYTWTKVFITNTTFPYETALCAYLNFQNRINTIFDLLNIPSK